MFWSMQWKEEDTVLKYNEYRCKWRSESKKREETEFASQLYPELSMLSLTYWEPALKDNGLKLVGLFLKLMLWSQFSLPKPTVWQIEGVEGVCKLVFIIKRFQTSEIGPKLEKLVLIQVKCAILSLWNILLLPMANLCKSPTKKSDFNNNDTSYDLVELKNIGSREVWNLKIIAR